MGATVHKAETVTDRDRVVSVLMLAFSSDPAVRWVFPDPQQYVDCFPDFLQGFAGNGFAHGSAYYAGDYVGAALWLPPGVHSDGDALDALFTRELGHRMARLVALFEEMDSYHPKEPHWYLPLMGVDPTRQGQGIGSALLKEALDRCDREGRPAYLESTSLGGNALYARHGFEMLGTIHVDGSPLLWPMVRAPEQWVCD